MNRLLVASASTVAFAIGFLATHQSSPRTSVGISNSAERQVSPGRVGQPTTNQPARPTLSAIAPKPIDRQQRIPVFTDQNEVHPAFAESFELSAHQITSLVDALAVAEQAESQLALGHVKISERTDHSITLDVPPLPEQQQAIDAEMRAKLEAALPQSAFDYLQHHGSAARDVHLHRRRYVIDWMPGSSGLVYRIASVIDGREYNAQQTTTTNKQQLPSEFLQFLAAVGVAGPD